MAGKAPNLDELEKDVVSLERRVSELERSAPICVPIETFAPEPYEVRKAFHAVLQAQGEEYVASFFDANLSASGATQEEAVFNLKDVIVAVFETLTEHEPAKLGPEPAKQLEVLKEFIRRTA